MRSSSTSSRLRLEGDLHLAGNSPQLARNFTVPLAAIAMSVGPSAFVPFGNEPYLIRCGPLGDSPFCGNDLHRDTPYLVWNVAICMIFRHSCQSELSEIPNFLLTAQLVGIRNIVRDRRERPPDLVARSR